MFPMTLQQLINLLEAMKTEYNQDSTIYIKVVESKLVQNFPPVLNAVLDKKYHLELTNIPINEENIRNGYMA